MQGLATESTDLALFRLKARAWRLFRRDFSRSRWQIALASRCCLWRRCWFRL